MTTPEYIPVSQTVRAECIGCDGAVSVFQWHNTAQVFIPNARNPRKNDPVVDRMCSSIREFGFKIPVLAKAIQRHPSLAKTPPVKGLRDRRRG